jgi:hypothetical protein
MRYLFTAAVATVVALALAVALAISSVASHQECAVAWG